MIKLMIEDCMNIRPNQLKIGDKINGHENGWLTVTDINEYPHAVEVTVDTANGEKVIRYPKIGRTFMDTIQVVRLYEGDYSRNRKLKEYIDNSDTIELLEDIIGNLKYRSKNMTKQQYYLLDDAYMSFQEYQNGSGSERDIYNKCRKFAEYCSTHNKNLTKKQDAWIDDILANT